MPEAADPPQDGDLDLLFEAAVAVVLLDRAGRILRRSSLWATEFLPDPDRDVVGVHIGQAITVTANFDELFAAALAGRSTRGTVAYPSPSGRERHKTFEATPWRPRGRAIQGVSFTSFDVTDLVVARLELESYKRRLNAALEGSGTLVYELDPATDQILVDGPVDRLLGPNFDLAALTTQLISVVAPQDQAAVREGWRVARAAGTALRTECRIARTDGAELWVAGTIERRSLPGAPMRVAGMIHDITPVKRAQLAFERAAQAAEAANRAKSEFLANMSHELRTPLNGVVGVTSALARTALDDEQREMVGLIETSAHALEGLLADVLDLARIEADGFEPACDSTDLAAFVGGVAMLFKWRAHDKGVRLGWSLDGPVGGRWLCDQARIRQILFNLLSNAVKFTEAGRIDLLVRAPASGGVAFEVADTGIGFDDAALERLFGRFEQADGSITRRYGGTGLGLAISRALALRMGGALTGASRPGAGSTFTLWLPLVRGPEAPRAPEPRRREETTGLGLRETPLEVLLAEDHPVNQRVVALILASLGVRLVIVENGAEAVARLESGRFHLVLMDVQMPVMDGLTAIRTVRRHEAEQGARRTPIVALTANAMPEHVNASLEAGADAHLSKPITAEALVEIVARLTGAAAAAGSAD